MNAKFIKLCSLISIFQLSGCFASGVKFEKLEFSDKAKSVIYVYRPSQFVGGAVPYDFFINNKEFVTLYNGGYSYIFANPGVHTIEMRQSFLDVKIKLKVEANKSYFVKMHSDFFLLWSEYYLTEENEESGLIEIAEMKFQKPIKTEENELVLANKL